VLGLLRRTNLSTDHRYLAYSRTFFSALVSFSISPVVEVRSRPWRDAHDDRLVFYSRRYSSSPATTPSTAQAVDGARILYERFPSFFTPLFPLTRSPLLPRPLALTIGKRRNFSSLVPQIEGPLLFTFPFGVVFSGAAKMKASGVRPSLARNRISSLKRQGLQRSLPQPPEPALPISA